MARVTDPNGHTKVVKNLAWFFRKARTSSIRSIVLTHVEHSYVMEVVFDDNFIFVTPFNDLQVFWTVMGRQRSLQGQMYTIIDQDEKHMGAYEYMLSSPRSMLRHARHGMKVS
jgi:hypothetical protein